MYGSPADNQCQICGNSLFETTAHLQALANNMLRMQNGREDVKVENQLPIVIY